MENDPRWPPSPPYYGIFHKVFKKIFNPSLIHWKDFFCYSCDKQHRCLLVLEWELIDSCYELNSVAYLSTFPFKKILLPSLISGSSQSDCHATFSQWPWLVENNRWLFCHCHQEHHHQHSWQADHQQEHDLYLDGDELPVPLVGWSQFCTEK